jgi:hypothetical protein
VTERLTLDTNLLQEYWREQAKRDVVQQLLDFAKTGAAELVVTARIGEDIPGGPLAERLRELPDMGIGQIGSVTRLDSWVLGRDMLGSDIFNELQKRADAELLRRGRATVPDWRDWDHVHAHFLRHRDIFLTWDKRLAEAVGIVAEHLPIKMMTPENYLAARQIAEDVMGQLEVGAEDV